MLASLNNKNLTYAFDSDGPFSSETRNKTRIQVETFYFFI